MYACWFSCYGVLVDVLSIVCYCLVIVYVWFIMKYARCARECVFAIGDDVLCNSYDELVVMCCVLFGIRSVFAVRCYLLCYICCVLSVTCSLRWAVCDVLCVMCYELCDMRDVLCVMCDVLCVMWYVLCVIRNTEYVIHNRYYITILHNTDIIIQTREYLVHYKS